MSNMETYLAFGKYHIYHCISSEATVRKAVSFSVNVLCHFSFSSVNTLLVQNLDFYKLVTK